MPSDFLVDAYFQADTVRGYRYLDDAGKIMNRWDSQFPEKSVGLEGLTMANKSAVMRQLRVDTRTIWLNLHSPDNLQQVQNLAYEVTSEISDTIGVDQFRRVGLRLQYVYGVRNTDIATAPLVRNLLAEEWLRDIDSTFWTAKAFEFMVPLPAEGINVNLRVALVRRNPIAQAGEKIPVQGIMIDLDLFRSEVTDLRDLKGILRKAAGWADGEFPRIRERVLQGVEIEYNV